MTMIQEQDTSRKAWLAAFAFAAFRLWYVSRIQLSADEAYYWEWSRNLSLSYYDQGPMLALAIRVGSFLFGPTELGVRFMSVFCALLSSGLAIACCIRLRRPAASLWVVLAMNSMLLFSVGAVLMMHDSLMGFFWILALYSSLRALENSKFWLLTGLAAGGALLSKYTGVLIFGCLLLGLSTHSRLRPQLKSPWLWIGAALGLALGLSPILIWNSRNGWPSFQHVFSLAGADHSRQSMASFPEFAASQITLITPLLFWLVAKAWWRGRNGGVYPGDLERRDGTRWMLWCFGAPVILFFTMLSLRTRVEGNWPAQAYIAGLLLVAMEIDLHSKMARWAIGVAAIFSVLAHLQAASPFLPISQQYYKLDSTARVDGWREMASEAQSRKALLKADAFVACRTYQIAAELAFYMPGQARLLIVQNGQINHQYRFWNDPESFRGRDALLVVGQDWEVNEMREHFKTVKEAGLFEAKRHGIVTQTFHFYTAKEYKP